MIFSPLLKNHKVKKNHNLQTTQKITYKLAYKVTPKIGKKRRLFFPVKLNSYFNIRVISVIATRTSVRSEYKTGGPVKRGRAVRDFMEKWQWNRIFLTMQQ